MDKYRWLVYWRKTRELLFGKNSREFFVFLFFLFISASFWMLQALDETTEMKIGIPMQITDKPDEVKIITELPEELTVTVRDKGIALLRYWQHTPDTINISFPDYDNGSIYGVSRISQGDVMQLVSDRLQSTTRVVSIAPDTLEFSYNHGLHKTVPVVMNGTAEADAEHYLLSLVPSPSQVVVYGAASVLDTLQAVYTTAFNMTELSHDSIINIRMRNLRGARMEPAYVKVKASVDVYMEGKVEVPIRTANFPGGKSLRTFPTSVTVTYKIGYTQAKEIKPEDFLIVITYDDLLKVQAEGGKSVPLRLRDKPQQATSIRISPEEVEFLIETNEQEGEE